jgi:hypothetical protein
MLCAKDRTTGTMRLVTQESFASRRDAVEALSVVRDLSDLMGTDVYLVDLDTAVPVALVPCGPGGIAETPAAEEKPAAPEEAIEEAVPEQVAEEAPAATEELPEWATAEPGATLGVLQIDIDAWTCEDCIYVTTCAFSGTRRPSQCLSFQWRA